MTFEQRNTWWAAVLIPLTTIIYFVIVIPRAMRQPVSEVSWVTPMLWAIGVSIAGTIIGSIVSSIVTAIITRDDKMEADIRDKQIDRYGDRIAQGITAFGTAAVLVLTMLKLDHFWIGNTLFLIGAIGATWGAVAKIRAYHGGFHG